jgi:hypothetical protein
MNLRLCTVLVVFVFSLLFSIQFVILANGDVVNNYPYISPDGFDWYTQGLYITKLLNGAVLPELPVLRPPVFVLVTAADNIAGGHGFVLAMVLGIAILSSYYFTLKIIDTANSGQYRNSWYLVPLAIGTTIYPMNFFKPYLLSDGLAVAISLASVHLLVRYDAEHSTRILVISVSVAVLAGLTQTYALIPFATACLAGALIYYQSNRGKSYSLMWALFATAAIFALLTFLWRWVIPHASTPQNFELLKLNTNMFGFYFQTWGYYFLPFILFFLIYRRFKFVWSATNLVMIVVTVVLLLMASLCLIYQWPEARFTYYLWPWLMILIFTATRLETIRGVYLVSTLLFLLVLVVPANYWVPSWPSMRVSISHNWVGEYFMAKPTDRKLNICRNECKDSNEFLKNSDPYVNSTLKIYNQIKGL